MVLDDLGVPSITVKDCDVSYLEGKTGPMVRILTSYVSVMLSLKVARQPL